MGNNKEIDKAVKALAEAAACIESHDALFLITIKDDEEENSNVNVCGFTSTRILPLELMGLSKLFDSFMFEYISNIKERNDISDELSDVLDELRKKLLDKRKKDEEDEDEL